MVYRSVLRSTGSSVDDREEEEEDDDDTAAGPRVPLLDPPSSAGVTLAIVENCEESCVVRVEGVGVVNGSIHDVKR